MTRSAKKLLRILLEHRDLNSLNGWPLVPEQIESRKNHLNWLTPDQQELSYRKQIARQLTTQFVEGISMTLKSTFRVTQSHWKRNHSTDHTRLTTRRVIGRWILYWPWNVGQRSLKVIEISAIRKVGCDFLFAFYSNCGRICSRLWDIQCRRMV